MRRRFGLLLLFGLVLAGCRHTKPTAETDAWYSHYHAPQFAWERVSRVLLVPMTNESTFPYVAEEVRNALASELQRLGRFEVIPAPPDVAAQYSQLIRENGAFNEAVLLQMARVFRADVVVLGTISQYSPYQLPRLGIVLQAISPHDAQVIASVDGLWDSSQLPVAQRARAFYRTDAKPREAPFTADLVLESPRLYQRFVCAEAARLLVADPAMMAECLPASSAIQPGSGKLAGNGARFPASAVADPLRDGR